MAAVNAITKAEFKIASNQIESPLEISRIQKPVCEPPEPEGRASIFPDLTPLIINENSIRGTSKNGNATMSTFFSYISILLSPNIIAATKTKAKTKKMIKKF